MRITRKSSVFSCAFALGTWLIAGVPANAAGLFDPASSTDMRSAGTSRSTEGAVRHRLVRLNAGELARIVPPGPGTVESLAQAQSLSETVAIELFPGTSVTVNRTDIDTTASGSFVWTGKQIGSGRDSFVTLVINGDRVVGHVQTGNHTYSIEPASGGLHRVIQVDPSKSLKDIHQALPPGAVNQKRSESGPEDVKAKTTYNVLVGHTVNARKEVGTTQQMQDRIDMAIALTNTAFTNSGVLIKFKRVGGENEITYKDTTLYGGANVSNNYVAVLYDLAGLTHPTINNNNQAKFNALRMKRDAVAADLVVLMRKQGTACGIAFVPSLDGTVTAGNSNLGYSVTTSTPGGVYNCVEGNTLAHETGHNQGMNHDRIQHQKDYNLPNPPPKTQYNFGYVDNTHKFITIMSYFASCNGGSGCTRAPFFSTPKKNFNGNVVGIAAGKKDAADAVRLLNENRATVGGYR